jgi:L-cysteine S-thiosulfotransferase
MTARLAIFVAALAGVSAIAMAEGERIRSATDFLSPSMKAEQADDASNPAMLWVEEGSRIWSEPQGQQGKSCADCHGDAQRSMRGVAARYPAIDATSGKLLNLELQINQCRTQHMGAPAFDYESQSLLSLTAYVAKQSRGLPVVVETRGAAADHLERGQRFWTERQGQYNLACQQCHSDNVGRKLRGDTISSGIATGYPAYRLAWQTIGSLHRRLNDCQRGVRAAALPAGSREHLALELFLAARARGQSIEAPGLRR